MRYLIILTGAVCLSFILLPSCAPQPEQQAEPVSEEAPATEADLAALNEVIKQWEEAMNASDLDRCLTMLTEDVVWMPPGENTVVGKEAARAWLQAMFDQYDSESDFSSAELEVFGDWAFDRGTYKLTITPEAEGEAAQDVGKYLDIFKRQSDGSWKYARGIWNSDNPPPEEPTI